jgi:hypothetical protein
MKEVTKREFKRIYFKYGKSEDGWTRSYWKKFYGKATSSDLKCKVELPRDEDASRMMIVDDHSRNEVRLFFVSVEQEGRFFDHRETS